MTGVIERLKSIRSHLGETQKSMSSRLSLGDSTWQNYERGIHFPGFEVLAKLMEWGFSAEWIISGNGSMLIRAASQNPINRSSLTDHQPIDPELMGKINDVISRTYRDVGGRINPADIGRMAAKWYDLVIQIDPDPVAHAAALTILATQLKAELTAPVAVDTNNKRRA